MGFIESEAIEESTNNQPLVFYDDEDEITKNEIKDFIDDFDQQKEGVSFYGQLDPENVEHY